MLQSVLLPERPDQAVTPLTRVPLAMSNPERSERWLQELLFAHPSLIPVSDVSPGTLGFVPICRELSLQKPGGTVYLDIFGITPEGRCVLIECKLWRNPEARREVIGQIMDYAGLLRKLTYADLSAQLKGTLNWTGSNPLYDLVAKHAPGTDEGVFVDRVTKSLRSGDFILIIAGDGIRSDVQSITEQINDRGGLGGHLALVEFQLWSDEHGRTLVVPAIPLRTEVIRQRVLISMDGLPIEVATIEETDQSGASGAPPSLAKPGADEERHFWQSVIDRSVFDHADQPPPRHGGRGWIKLSMPLPVGMITAYRSTSGEGGLYFALKGHHARSVYEAIVPQPSAWISALGEPLQGSIKSEEPFVGELYLRYPGNPLDDESFREWIVEKANRLVTLLRPLLSEIARPA